MTPIDDLKRGDYIAVTYDMNQAHPWDKGQPEYNGVPMRVEEISLPFLCVTDGRQTLAVDVRRWCVQKVTKRYALMMWKGPDEKKKRKRKPKPDARDCPRCGTRMIEALMFEAEGRGWRLICRGCNHDAGPAREERT
jgi:hypothetical protein